MLAAELRTNLSQLKSNLTLNKAPAADPAASSLETFSALPNNQQQEILSMIATSVRILTEQLNPEVYKTPREQEVARIKNAIRSFNMKPKSDDVFNIISTDDVIELYTPSGIQLYRNLKFFKMCSYNVLDLHMNPWDELYEKPSSVIDQTLKVIQKAFLSDGRPVPYSMEPFLQKEKFRYAGLVKTVRVTPRYLVPLYDPNSEQFAGAFATNTGEIIAEGPNSNRFSTI